MEVRDLCWYLTSSVFFLSTRSISWGFLNSSAVCNSSWHIIHQPYSKVTLARSVTLYQQPTHPTPILTSPPKTFRLPHNDCRPSRLYTDNNHGERDAPERRDVEGGHGGDGGGPGSSSKAQLRSGPGRHGAQEHDHLRRKVGTTVYSFGASV